jgi:two-component system, cell cycle response regulator
VPEKMQNVTTDTPTRLVRAAQGVAVLLVLGLAAHALVSAGDRLAGPSGRWVYGVPVAFAAVACLMRAARGHGERLPWALFGAALASWAAAQLGYGYLSPRAGGSYPAAADALFLAFFPAGGAALVVLVRRRLRGRRRAALWLDGLAGALAVATVGDVAVLRPLGAGHAVFADLALLALLVGIPAITGWRPGRGWLLIGVALVVASAADAVYATHTGYSTDGLVDALRPAAALLIAAAAWEPAGGDIEPRSEDWITFMLPVAFSLAALGVLVVDHFHRLDTLATALAAATLAAVIARTAVTFGDNLRMIRASRREAMTDPLTGLGNRRCLMVDMLTGLEDATAANPLALILFDLDGFKRYNDNFGHPAGDALLARIGRNLEGAVGALGRAYRLGGDEFCALVSATPDEAGRVVASASAALTEHGRGFVVGASHGVAFMPSETVDPSAAMQLADQRLYGNKGHRERSSLGQQTRDVLLQVLEARQPALRDHIHEVADLAVVVGRRLGLNSEGVAEMAHAAELHDVGKMAIPDEILQKPGPLDPVELGFVRQHSLVGERILAASPALSPAARLVRASHERWDGSGYPDGLAGDEIPLASRIIAVCDAYHAMTSARPYRMTFTPRQAVAELRRCAGSHFDPAVVAAVCTEIESRRLNPLDSPLTVDVSSPTLTGEVQPR